jgi:cytochrome c oxidase subunit IV
MSSTDSHAGYKSYWVTWVILLVITGIMLVIDVSPMSKLVVIGLLMAAMIVKAVLIGGQFMHLRFEKPGLVVAVAGSVIFLGTYLFILIVFDALRISHMVKP